MTPRTRRTKPQQARDILLALLKGEEAEAEKHKAAFEGANLRATSTRRAIELLDQAMLPGMEPPNQGDDLRMPNLDGRINVPSTATNNAASNSPCSPHRREGPDGLRT